MIKKLAILFCCLILLNNHDLSYSIKKSLDERLKEFYKNPVQKINTRGTPFSGKAKSPIHIIVFSDYQCKFCWKAFYGLEKFRKKYSPYIKISYINYAFKESGKLSQLSSFQLAQYSMVANERGKYLRFVDKLFSLFLQKVYIDEDRIKRIFSQIEIQLPFNDIKKRAVRYRKHILKKIAIGEKLEIDIVPAIFINGRFAGDFKQKVIDQILQKEIAKLK